ncbi:oxidoreductase [Cryptococcus neoformans c45]|nr:oxidoreductase [Cryptococcus neoformans var. grubii c45]
MSQSSMRTVVVLGASYGGCHASKMLAEELPPNWRLIVIDRNSHFNHVYAFPRFTVMSHHAPKGFIPYKRMLEPQPKASSDLLTPPQTPPTESATLPDELAARSRHQFVQALVTKLTSREVTFIRPTHQASSSISTTGNMTYGEFDGAEETIKFDYLLYALGSTLPDPVNVWQPIDESAVGEERKPGTKKRGLRFMELQKEKFKQADRILIVGGGALGIEYASDLKDLYPEKKITLLHSRTRVMPLYPIELHMIIIEALTKMGVEVVLGERVVTWPDEPETLDGKTKYVTTDKSRTFEADIVLPCTGQKPHVSLMAEVNPALISPITSRIRVLPTQQVHPGPIPPVKVESAADQLAQLSLGPAPITPPASDGGSSEISSGIGHSEAAQEEDYSHIFAIGDCAETKAIQAGHTAYWMGEIAVRNILRLIAKKEGGEKKNEPLEDYKPGPPAIKITLGINNAVVADGNGVITNSDGIEDMHSLVMWPTCNAEGMDVNE